MLLPSEEVHITYCVCLSAFLSNSCAAHIEITVFVPPLHLTWLRQDVKTSDDTITRISINRIAGQVGVLPQHKGRGHEEHALSCHSVDNDWLYLRRVQIVM